VKRVKPSMVDIEIQSFSDWKESLEKEDIEQVGTALKRGEKELMRMWSSYYRFQNSEQVKSARAKLLSGARK
jgi:RNA polymerase-interacting CarD/CdnL/TRCF family regulator